MSDSDYITITINRLVPTNLSDFIKSDGCNEDCSGDNWSQLYKNDAYCNGWWQTLYVCKHKNKTLTTELGSDYIPFEKPAQSPYSESIPTDIQSLVNNLLDEEKEHYGFNPVSTEYKYEKYEKNNYNQSISEWFQEVKDRFYIYSARFNICVVPTEEYPDVDIALRIIQYYHSLNGDNGTFVSDSDYSKLMSKFCLARVTEGCPGATDSLDDSGCPRYVSSKLLSASQSLVTDLCGSPSSASTDFYNMNNGTNWDSYISSYCLDYPSQLACACEAREDNDSRYHSAYEALAQSGNFSQGPQCWFLPCRGSSLSNSYLLNTDFLDVDSCDIPQCNNIVIESDLTKSERNIINQNVVCDQTDGDKQYTGNVICGTNEDCESNQYCNTATHECIDNCSDDNPCTETQTCTDGICINNSGCNDDSDCDTDSGEKCNISNGDCIFVPCWSGGSCPNNQVCDEIHGGCVDKCTSNDDCDDEQICDTDSGLCGDKCQSTEDDCIGGQYCDKDSGFCKDGDCFNDDDCSTGNVCVSNTCVTEDPDSPQQYSTAKIVAGVSISLLFIIMIILGIYLVLRKN